MTRSKRDVSRAVGRRIAAARQARHWTLTDLAERLQWPRDTLIHYEYGRRSIPLDRLVELAQALAVHPASLLIEEPDLAQLLTTLSTDPGLRQQVAFFVATLDEDADPLRGDPIRHP